MRFPSNSPTATRRNNTPVVETSVAIETTDPPPDYEILDEPPSYESLFKQPKPSDTDHTETT